MMKKILFSLVFSSVNVAMLTSSTPVGQGIPFPAEAPNQKEAYAQAKRDNRPPVVQTSIVPVRLQFDNKRGSGSLSSGNAKRQK